MATVATYNQTNSFITDFARNVESKMKDSFIIKFALQNINLFARNLSIYAAFRISGLSNKEITKYLLPSFITELSNAYFDTSPSSSGINTRIDPTTMQEVKIIGENEGKIKGLRRHLELEENVLLVAPSGVGKSAFFRAFCKQVHTESVAAKKMLPEFYQIEVGQCAGYSNPPGVFQNLLMDLSERPMWRTISDWVNKIIKSMHISGSKVPDGFQPLSMENRRIVYFDEFSQVCTVADGSSVSRMGNVLKAYLSRRQMALEIYEKSLITIMKKTASLGEHIIASYAHARFRHDLLDLPLQFVGALTTEEYDTLSRQPSVDALFRRFKVIRLEEYTLDEIKTMLLATKTKDSLGIDISEGDISRVIEAIAKSKIASSKYISAAVNIIDSAAREARNTDVESMNHSILDHHIHQVLCVDYAIFST